MRLVRGGCHGEGIGGVTAAFTDEEHPRLALLRQMDSERYTASVVEQDGKERTLLEWMPT